MSVNVFLVKFSKLKNGSLCDEESKTLDSLNITYEITNFLDAQGYLHSIDIYEDKGEDSVYQVSAILKKDLVEILDIFMKKSENKMKFITEENCSSREKNEAIAELTMLLNFRKILLSKLEKYRDDETIALIMR